MEGPREPSIGWGQGGLKDMTWGSLHGKPNFTIWPLKPRVRKIRVRNSGAGNGCANFMDTSKKSILSAGQNHVRKIPLLGGGGVGGGGSADFIFMGARIFLRSGHSNPAPQPALHNSMQ